MLGSSPRVALAALALAAAPACASHPRAGASAMTVGGGVLAASGGLLLADLRSPGQDTDGNGVDDFPENDILCAVGGCLLAGTMLAVGVSLVVFGVIRLAQTAPPAAPPLVFGPGAPRVGELDLRIAAPLPELPCDALTLRLARRARALASGGHCSAAHRVVGEIGRRDPVYADALIDSPALARCPPAFVPLERRR